MQALMVASTPPPHTQHTAYRQYAVETSGKGPTSHELPPGSNAGVDGRLHSLHSCHVCCPQHTQRPPDLAHSLCHTTPDVHQRHLGTYPNCCCRLLLLLLRLELRQSDTGLQCFLHCCLKCCWNNSLVLCKWQMWPPWWGLQPQTTTSSSTTTTSSSSSLCWWRRQRGYTVGCLLLLLLLLLWLPSCCCRYCCSVCGLLLASQQ